MVGARVWLAAACIGVSAAGAVAQTPVQFRLIRAGLFDAEHTNPATGASSSFFQFPGEGSVLVGTSHQGGLPFSPGFSAWVFDTATFETTRVGLLDDEHTSAAGLRASEVTHRRLGCVFGTSRRYAGAAQQGGSVWRYTTADGVLVRMGLFGSEYTGADNSRLSAISRVNARGDACGTSARYVGGVTAGQAAWVLPRDGGGVVRIGLVDPAHTSGGTPVQHSTVRLMDEQGRVAGVSTLYHGAPMPPGQSAWVYNPATGVTTRVGLLGPDYVDVSGYHYSDVAPDAFGLGDGFVAGTTHRYLNSQFKGTDAWICDLATGVVTPLGPHGPVVTSATGLREARLSRLTQGLVLGYSLRYEGGWSPLGNVPWWADAATGVGGIVGLTGPEHTSSSGLRSSFARPLNETFLAGSSTRYSGATQLGSTAWLYRFATGEHTPVGYTDAAHTKASGNRNSSVLGTCEGVIVGVSERTETEGHYTLVTLWGLNPAGGEPFPLGLYGPEHFNSAGKPASWILPPYDYVVRPSQYIFGNSKRGAVFGGGYTPWVRDMRSGQVHRLGLEDFTHTAASGLRESVVHQSVKAGRVYGYSTRYFGPIAIGRSLFVHDLSTGEVLPIVVQVGPDGQSYTMAPLWAVTDSGEFAGFFRDFQASAQGPYVSFYWSPGTGVRLMDSVVAGGFESAGYVLPQSESEAQQVFQVSPAGVFWGNLTLPATGERIAFVMRQVACTPDFDGDGDAATDADIEAFFACLGGNCCRTCGTADFNADGDPGTDADIESFFRVLAGGPC